MGLTQESFLVFSARINKPLVESFESGTFIFVMPQFADVCIHVRHRIILPKTVHVVDRKLTPPFSIQECELLK